MSFCDEDLRMIKLPQKTYEFIELSVASLFSELEITKYPIDPFDIIGRKGYVLFKYADLSLKKRLALRSQGRDAISFYNPNTGRFEIYYDSSQSWERIRFTLMHEVGHIVLGHKEESDLAKKMADAFAAYALAPSPIIMKFKCEDYIDIMNTFSVSEPCARIIIDRYNNWFMYGGSLKEYEKILISLFESSNINERGDAYE